MKGKPSELCQVFTLTRSWDPLLAAVDIDMTLAIPPLSAEVMTVAFGYGFAERTWLHRNQQLADCHPLHALTQ